MVKIMMLMNSAFFFRLTLALSHMGAVLVTPRT
jgi:hypothetical protein